MIPRVSPYRIPTRWATRGLQRGADAIRSCSVDVCGQPNVRRVRSPPRWFSLALWSLALQSPSPDRVRRCQRCGRIAHPTRNARQRLPAAMIMISALGMAHVERAAGELGAGMTRQCIIGIRRAPCWPRGGLGFARARRQIHVRTRRRAYRATLRGDGSSVRGRVRRHGTTVARRRAVLGATMAQRRRKGSRRGWGAEA